MGGKSRFRQEPLGEILTDRWAWHASGIDCRRYLDNRILNTSLQLLQRTLVEVTDLKSAAIYSITQNHNLLSCFFPVLIFLECPVFKKPGYDIPSSRPTAIAPGLLHDAPSTTRT